MKWPYRHYNTICWEYRNEFNEYENPYFNNQIWKSEEIHFVSVGIDTEKLFRIIDLYYDGHTMKGFTFLGLHLALGYSPIAMPLSQWEAENEIKDSKQS